MKLSLIKRVSTLFDSEISDYQKKKYLILFSAGLDSVALVNILSELIPTSHLNLLHCNYQLRGKENEREEFILKQLARRKKINFFLEIRDLKKYKQNLQAEARRLRYQIAENLCQKWGIEYVITAHHIDDYLELFFLKMFAGGSPLAVVNFLEFKKGPILRPFISTFKSEIVQVVHQNKWGYSIDRSNLSDDYQRNFLRNKVFPLFQARFKSWKNNMLLFNHYLKDINQLTNQGFRKWVSIQEKFIFLKKDFLKLSLEKKRILLHFSFYKVYPHKRMNKGFIKEVEKKINGGNKSVVLGDIQGHKIVYSYRVIGPKLLTKKITLLDKGSIVQDELAFTFNFKSLQGLTEKKYSIKYLISLKSKQLEKVIIHSLEYKLLINYQQKKITLKKLFSDNKIPHMIRDSLLGVYNGNKMLAVINPLFFVTIRGLTKLINNVNLALKAKDKTLLKVIHRKL